MNSTVASVSREDLDALRAQLEACRTDVKTRIPEWTATADPAESGDRRLDIWERVRDHFWHLTRRRRA